MAERAGEAERRRYRYPGRSRLTWLGALLVSAGLGATAVVFQFRAGVDAVMRGQLLLFTALFAAVAVHAWGVLRIMRRPVELARDGIVGADGLVPWSRVRAVEIHPFAQRMDVFDADGGLILSLRPELEAFGGVQDYIIAHMEPQPEAPPVQVALLGPYVGASLLVGFGLIAVWFGPRQSGVPALLLATCALLVAVLLRVRRRSLLLERDRLVLREGGRRLEVAWRDITDVRVRDLAPCPRGPVHAVVLERSGAEPVVIAGFRAGWRAGAAAIGRAWRGEGRELGGRQE